MDYPANTTLTCRQLARRNPFQALTVMAISSLFAIIITLSVGSWVRETHPITVVINSVQVDGRFLVVSAVTDAPGKCLRHSVHVLYRDEADGQRTYITIGTGLNGMGLGGTVPNFQVKIPLPDTLTGKWTYINRSVYSCPPFGLIRGSYTTSPPVEVDLDGN